MREVPRELQALAEQALPPRELHLGRQPAALAFLVGDEQQDVRPALRHARILAYTAASVSRMSRSTSEPAADRSRWKEIGAVARRTIRAPIPPDHHRSDRRCLPGGSRERPTHPFAGRRGTPEDVSRYAGRGA